MAAAVAVVAVRGRGRGGGGRGEGRPSKWVPPTNEEKTRKPEHLRFRRMIDGAEHTWSSKTNRWNPSAEPKLKAALAKASAEASPAPSSAHSVATAPTSNTTSSATPQKLAAANAQIQINKALQSLLSQFE